jgi:hypothetical protein
VFFCVFQGPECSGAKEINPPPIQGPVVFELKGLLSPKKMRAGFSNNDNPTDVGISDTQGSYVGNNSDEKIKESRKESGLMTPHKMPINQNKVSIFIY